MEGQNGMLRYTKRNRKKKVETKRQRKILTIEKKRHGGIPITIKNTMNDKNKVKKPKRFKNQ